VNFGLHKNMLGTIRQPEFILFDTDFLQTLPQQEWSNGFAEVIKYGCIFDSFLFEALLEKSLAFYQTDPPALKQIIEKSAAWKNKTVQEDESDKGIRKLLNFGHTVGHAVEKQLEMPHGYAVSIGMLIACRLSEKICSLEPQVTETLRKLLGRYHLPTEVSFDPQTTMQLIQMDKKRNDDKIDFILLETLGKARIETISFNLIEETLIRIPTCR
jgi:3-dehydroquinate synthase